MKFPQAPKLALLLLLPALFAHAADDGGAGTGGGIGILCGKKLRTLDMYEGEVVRKLKPAPGPNVHGKESNLFTKNLVHYIRRYALAISDDGKMPKASDEEIIASFVRPFLKKIQFVDEDLPASGDATLPALERGCRAVQIATQSAHRDPTRLHSDDTLRIKVNKKYWKMLDARQRAALFWHEIFYAVRRADPSVVLSDDTRKMVAGIFFESGDPVFKDTWDTGVKNRYCHAINRFVYDTNGSMIGRFPTDWRVSETIRDGQKGLLFAFSKIDGEQLVSRTTMFVPGLDLATYGAGMHQPIQGVAKQDFDGREWDIKIDPAPSYSYGSIDFSWLSVAAKAKDKPEFRKELVYGRCSSFSEDWDVLQGRRAKAAAPASEPAIEEAITNSAE